MSKLVGQMPAVDGKTTVNYSRGYNEDIIKQIHKNFQIGVIIVAAIAAKFKGKNAKATAFRVWKFLRLAIKYRRDSEKNQDIRMPNRFVRDATGDCKSYSLFAASVLASLGLPVRFRYAAYPNSKGSTTPTHVYVVTEDEQGNDLIVDGVYNKFNQEKNPLKKYDYKMQINTLSGFGNIGYVGSIGDVDNIEGIDGIGKIKLKKLLKLAVKAGNPLHHLKVGVKAFKKIGLSVPRKSFQLLVVLNARGLASKLALVDKDKLAKKWKRLGGNPNSLFKSINKGKKHKPLLGGKKLKARLRAQGASIKAIEGLFGILGIGVEPASTGTAALLVSASSILAALVGLLKSVKVNKDGQQVDSASEEAPGTSIDATLDTAREAGGDTTLPPGAVVTDSESGAGNGAGVASEEDLEDEVKAANRNAKRSGDDDSGTGVSLTPTMKVVVFGGGAILLGKMFKIF